MLGFDMGSVIGETCVAFKRHFPELCHSHTHTRLHAWGARWLSYIATYPAHGTHGATAAAGGF